MLMLIETVVNFGCRKEVVGRRSLRRAI